MSKSNIAQLLNTIFSEDVVDIKIVFERKLSEYNLSKTKALRLLNIDKDVFEDIVSGSAKQPNLIHVVKIAEFLGYDIHEFTRIVLSNQSVENLASIENARKATFLVKNFDVKKLTDLGFFEKSIGIDKLIEKILTYFGYDSILEFEKQLDEPLYSKVKRLHSEKMKDFWIKSAYQTFKIIDNPNEYNRNRLKELIVKIKPYSQDVSDGLLTVCQALYNIGVTVIFQKYLPTTQVRGATIAVNNKPCIVITDYNKVYPTLWFTLVHELSHVLFDFETIEKTTFHLSDDSDLFLIEEKANSFARSFFMDEDKFHYIKHHINNTYIVNRFAKEIEIHPSLVYSFYAWYQDKLYMKNYHGTFKKLFPDYIDAIKKLNPIAWDEASLRQAGNKIKKALEINSSSGSLAGSEINHSQIDKVDKRMMINSTIKPSNIQ